MILGVDHLAASTDDIDRSSTWLESVGYKTALIERNLPNGLPKLPFLHEPAATHQIALCRHSKGIAIEWTQHEATRAGESWYTFLVDWPLPTKHAVSSSPDRSNVLEALLAGVGEEELLPSCWLEVPGCCGSIDRQGNRGIVAVAQTVVELQRSVRFWRDGLGAKEHGHGTTGRGARWCSLAFRGPLPSWSLDVVLVEGQHCAPRPMLDDSGSACLALIATDMTRDLARLAECGMTEVSEPFDLTVAGKALRISLVRGPDGELVELIQP